MKETSWLEDAAEILLVEDNLSDAELALHALEESGVPCTVTHVSDGASALEYMLSSRAMTGRQDLRQPKLILLDLKLPHIGGLQVLKKIKSDPLTQSIPIVVLTSSQTEIELAESYKLGANSYVMKPMDALEFAQIIGKIADYWLRINEAREL
jgi:two-component system response regulator